MPHSTTREVVVAVPPEKLFDVIADFARYPEFSPGVKATRPKPAAPGAPVDVEYEVDLGLKTVRYTLRHVLDRPRSLTWSLLSGEWMKVSNGSWELSPDPAGTRARYTVEVQISKPPLIPQSVIDKVTDELTKVQLPRTLEAFKKRAEQG
jgi:ribosome-associated toxin RatA of RatAB toxin-antitoxin module